MMQKAPDQLSARTILAGTFIASLLPFLFVELFPAQLHRIMATASYVAFHNIAEFFSIMVSLSIFGVGWYTYDQSKDRHALFASAAFLAIGLLDFMHTLSNAAMPAFITPNSGNKSTQLWIAARLLSASAFLLSAWVYPGQPSRWLSKPTLIAASLGIPALVCTGIIFFPGHMPATFVEGVGLTPFKKVSEYLVVCLLILASAAYWKRMARTGDGLLIYYLTAFVICIFSELVFAVYRSLFDTYNVLGHLYKIAAFYLIYRGIFVTSVNRPYGELSDANENLRREIAERARAEQEIHRLNEELEARVVQRTAALHDATLARDKMNADLQRELEQRKQAEAEAERRAQEAEAGRALLQSLMEFAPIGITMVGGPPEYPIVFNSRTAHELLRKPDASLLGLCAGHHAEAFGILLPDGTRPQPEQMPLYRASRHGEVIVDEEWAIQRPDDSRINILVNVGPIRDAHGQIVGAVNCWRDITERKRAERQLRLLSQALESAANGVAITDRQGVILWINPAFTRLTGYSSEEAVGHNPRVLKSGQHSPEFYRELWQTILRGEPWHGQLVNRRKDGTLYTEAMTITPVRSGGTDITHFIAIKEDITDRKRAEDEIMRLNAELEQRLVALGEANAELESFSYSISHDLRAPLRAIDGFSRILAEEDAPQLRAEAQRHLRLIRENTQQMGRLVDDLLAFSRLGRQPLQRQTVDLTVLVHEVFESLQPERAGRQVELVVGDLAPCDGDPALLRQVLVNLMANALKFARNRRPARIEVGCRTQAGVSVYFVRDNGVGFDNRYADKLFGVFQRLHRAEDYEGTGVGLAIVQRIIQRHGGRVCAEGEVDRGATFYFTLSGWPPTFHWRP